MLCVFVQTTWSDAKAITLRLEMLQLSRLPLPATRAVLLPIRQLMVMSGKPPPLAACLLKLLVVVPVEHDDHAFISVQVLDIGASTEKADIRAIRICVTRREKDWLAGVEFAAVDAMRQEALFAPRPQMSVDLIAHLFSCKLENHLPAARHRFLDQRRQRLLQLRFGQVIEEDFRQRSALVIVCDEGVQQADAKAGAP